ncbi:MAG: hypothetical protein WA871_01480 [Candidatus Acidiferrales bacterium]
MRTSTVILAIALLTSNVPTASTEAVGRIPLESGGSKTAAPRPALRDTGASTPAIGEASQVVASFEQEDLLSGVLLGQGFDTLAGKLKAQAVDPSKATSNTKAWSADGDYETSEQVLSTFESTDVGVSGGYSGLVYSAKFSVNYSEQSSMNSYDYYALAYEAVRGPSKILPGGPLSHPADARMSRTRFFNKYGDAWVSRVDMGGNLVALLQVHLQSQSQRQQLDASISASASAGNISATMSHVYEAMSSVGQVRTLFKETGGAAKFVDRDTLVTALTAYPGEVTASGGLPVGFGLSSYDVADWPTGTQVPFTPEEIRAVSNSVKAATDTAEQAQQLLGDADYILKHKDEFSFATVKEDTVDAEQQQLGRMSKQEIDTAEHIADAPFSHYEVSPVDLSGIKFPEYVGGPPSNVSIVVGVFGIAVAPGDSSHFAGFLKGTPLDSFSVQKAPGDALDIHFSYTGKFAPVPAFFAQPASTATQDASGGDGSMAKLVTRAWLLGISVSIGGNDAHLYDVHYRFHLKDGTQSETGTNGSLLQATTGNPPDGLLVYLERKN